MVEDAPMNFFHPPLELRMRDSVPVVLGMKLGACCAGLVTELYPCPSSMWSYHFTSLQTPGEQMPCLSAVSQCLLTCGGFIL